MWVHRIGHGKRTRIRGEYGTEAFWAAFDAAERGEQAALPQSERSAAPPKSLAWLIAQYRDSGAWRSLSVETRRQRENIFERIIEKSGRTPFAKITNATIQAGVDRRSDKPAAAKHFVSTMRGLFKWAVASGHAPTDPTQGVIKPRAKRTGGFPAWGDEWCAAYEKRWALGTRQRVWYEVIHCTGLRRSDAVRVGRQHVKNGRGVIRAAKNGETAYFTVSERLQAALAAGPVGDMTWIVGERGKPLKKESFGNEFREACDAAGVVGSAHGIRKTRATIEAENGASGAKLDALFGWRTGSKTSAIYIRNADRSKLAFGPHEPNENVYSLTLLLGEGIGAKKP